MDTKDPLFEYARIIKTLCMIDGFNPERSTNPKLVHGKSHHLFLFFFQL
jgi:hypothetical protein